MAEPLTVRLLINASTLYGRNLVRGVSRYVQEHEHWTLLFEPVAFGAPMPVNALKQADGVIARVLDARIASHVRDAGLPTINVSEDKSGAGLPRVITDDAEIAQMAAEHLFACGFRRFAFCGYRGKVYSETRQAAFQAWCDERDLPCEVYLSRTVRPKALNEELRVLADWLASLEKPTGVLATNDLRGHHVMLASVLAGVSVPQEIGVMGVDNDDVVCDLCPTPLSSIDPHAAEVGYRAAEYLHAWLTRGEEPPEETICGNATIHRRRSTDVLLVNDDLVKLALEYMRPKGRLPHTVEEVLKRLPISRRPFERRFLQATGLTPHGALSQIRIERAADLLTNTTLSITSISEKCGFNYGHHMAAAFRKAKGVTPGEYRRKYGKPRA